MTSANHDMAEGRGMALSPYHIAIVAIVALSIIFDGFDTYTLGLVVPAIAKEWGRSPSAFGTITALSTIATVAGSIFAGFVGDRIGRKYTLMIATLLYGGGSLISALAQTMPMLTASRIVTGIGLGAAVVTAVVIVSEHMPARYRSGAIVLTTLGIPLGHTLSGAAATAVLEPLGWRSLFLIGALVPAAMLALQAVALPETPAFMRGKKRYRKALDRYCRRTGMTGGAEAIVDPHSAPAAGRFAELFSRPYRRDTLLLWLGMSASVFITHIFSQWLPSLIAHAGATLTVASRAIVYFGIGQIGGALLAAPLIYWFGSRRPMLAGAIVTFTLASVLIVRFDAHPTASLTFVIFAMMAFVGSQMVALHHALGPAIYPESIRGRGTGLALAIGKSGALISSYGGAWALGLGGTAFFGVVAVAAVTQFCCFGLITRHARSGFSR